MVANGYHQNPFVSLDQSGVGPLIEMAVERGRRTNPGICGEHASDPASIEFFQRQGLDYVSCSPPGWRRPRCASSLEL